MERRHAYRLMQSAPIAREVSPMGHISERAVREIAKVAPEKRQEVFEKAAETGAVSTLPRYSEAIAGILMRHI